MSNNLTGKSSYRGAAALSAALLFFSVALFSVVPVQADNDGLLSSDSLGSTPLSLSIPSLVKLSGIENLNFGNYIGPGNAVLADDVCVYTNLSTGQYKITARGSGSSYAFTLTNGTQEIPYTVRWNNSTGTSGNVDLSANTTSSTFTGANTSSVTCSGGNSANFQVTISQNALLSVKAGSYNGILTLIVQPAS